MGIKFLLVVVASIILQISWAQAADSRDGIYLVTSDSVATPQDVITNGVLTSNEEATPYFFLEEEVFVATFHDDVVELSLVLDDDEIGEFPETIILSIDEFHAMNAEFATVGTIEELRAATFENDEATLQDASHGRTHKKKRARMHYKGARGCVAYVLSRIGWPGGPSGNGVMITRTLKRKLGYKTVSCKNPKAGTIASWSGGSGAGHTAIWNGKCWAYDIACGDPGKRYRLLECVAK